MTKLCSRLCKIKRDKEMLWYAAKRLVRNGVKPKLVVETVKVAIEDELKKMIKESIYCPNEVD